MPAYRMSYYPWITQHRSAAEVHRNVEAFAAAVTRELGSGSTVSVLPGLEVNKQIDQLQRANQRIKALPVDDVAAALREEATKYLNEAQCAVRGNFRAALQALQESPDRDGAATFMAGMVGQLMDDLNQLRDQFGLRDVIGDGRPGTRFSFTPQ